MERCITVLRLFGITITKPLCGTNGRRRDESGTDRHSYRLSLFIQFTVNLTQLASDVIRKEILFIILSFLYCGTVLFRLFFRRHLLVICIRDTKYHCIVAFTLNVWRFRTWL